MEVPHRFAWSSGGWFGSTLGTTLWMVLAGFSWLGASLVAGLVPVGAALLVCLWAWKAWQGRADRDPLRALLTLVVLGFLAALASIAAALAAGVLTTGELGAFVFALLVYPALFAFFHFQGKRERP